MRSQITYHRQLATVLIICFSIAFVSCTPKKMASDLTSKIIVKGAPRYEMESDVEIADDAAMALLKVVEIFQYDNPTNKNFNTTLARSYANYAMGYLEQDLLEASLKDEETYEKVLKKTKMFYKRGKDYGLNALKKKGSFKKALTKDMDRFNRVLRSMGHAQVPRLFWTALNWGSLINYSKNSPMAIAAFPRVEAMMQRVVELDEGYYYAVPHLFFGVAYATRPAMFGGNMPKAKKHFLKAINAYERKFLMSTVYYAQFYALLQKDKALFKSLLNEVLEADASTLPEARLANELAKLRAQWLLDNMKELFKKQI
jgi:hypothetical protein